MNALTRIIIATLALVVASTACNQPPAVNPWMDDSIGPEAQTTPSRDGFLAAGREPVLRKRALPQSEVSCARSGVPHYPLWWQDPFIDKGDGNKEFAWTWQDYIAMPYGLGRFILNTVAVPVSAVVHPPGMPMVSDGVVGRDHDTLPGKSPNPNATRDDFVHDDAPQTQPSTGI
jgi:hypothetical protein